MDYDRIVESTTCPADIDTYAYRIVFGKVVNGRPNNYATWQEIMPPDRPAYLVLGHYDMDFDAGCGDFKRRCKSYDLQPFVAGM